MMKIVIEPDRLQHFINMLLINGKLDSVIVTFKPAVDNEYVVEVADSTLDVAGVRALFKPSFFLEYENAEETTINITKSLLTGLKNGFNDDKSITLETNNNNIIIKGITDEYKEELTAGKQEPFILKTALDEEFGIQTESSLGENPAKPPSVRAIIDIGQLPNTTTDDFRFFKDKDTLKVSISDIGTFTRTLILKKTTRLEDIDIKFDGSHLSSILGILDGETWLSISSKSSTFAKVSKDHLITYFQAASGVRGETKK